MILKLFLCIVPFIIIINGENSNIEPDIQTELKMITTMFRHGERTPEANEVAMLPGLNASDTYYPVGLGQLTNAGKLRLYKNGLVFRKDYDDFFGDILVDGDVAAYTSTIPRTAASALTFLSGLFPPKGHQKWDVDNCKDLSLAWLRTVCAIQHACDVGEIWNPIPYVSNENITDEMLMFVTNCTEYLEELIRVENLPEIQDYIAEHQSLFEEIRKQTKVPYITSPGHVYFLYNLYSSFTSAGIKPPAWTEPIWEEILSVADKSFEFMFYNDKLKVLAAGAMTKRIVDDIVAKSKGELLPKNRKLIIYSGHDMSITALYACLGGEKGFANLYGDPYPVNLPNYGATIIIELHQIVETKKFAVKFFYNNVHEIYFEPLKLVECEELCPLEKFLELTEPYRITFDEQKQMCKKGN